MFTLLCHLTQGRVPLDKGTRVEKMPTGMACWKACSALTGLVTNIGEPSPLCLVASLGWCSGSYKKQPEQAMRTKTVSITPPLPLYQLLPPDIWPAWVPARLPSVMDYVMEVNAEIEPSFPHWVCHDVLSQQYTPNWDTNLHRKVKVHICVPLHKMWTAMVIGNFGFSFEMKIPQTHIYLFFFAALWHP